LPLVWGLECKNGSFYYLHAKKRFRVFVSHLPLRHENPFTGLLFTFLTAIILFFYALAYEIVETYTD
jgi:hypothetical protein